MKGEEYISIAPTHKVASSNIYIVSDKSGLTDGDFDYRSHYEIDAEVFDYQYAGIDAATKHENRRLHEYIVKQVNGKGAAVLDVGCGRGWVAEELIDDASIVFSADVSLKNVQLSLANNPAANHHGIVCDGYNIPIRDSTLDYIIACEVLEHTIDPEAFVRSLLSKVKVGGKVIITTPYNEVIEQNLCIHCNCLTPRHAHLHSVTKDKMLHWTKSIEKSSVTLTTFSNKYMARLRTHIILKYVPFGVWKVVDKFANAILPKPERIMAVIER